MPTFANGEHDCHICRPERVSDRTVRHQGVQRTGHATQSSHRIDIAVPPADVFAYATDPATFPEWQSDVVRARMEHGRAARRGIPVCHGPAHRRPRATMTQEITELAAPRRWAARGVDGPLRPRAAIEIEPLPDDAGSRVTSPLDFEGRGFGDLLLPMVRRIAAKGAPDSYRRLKALLESRHTRPASL